MGTFLMLAVGAVLASAQSDRPLPPDLDRDSRARVPYLQRKDMDESSQKIFDKLPGRSQEGILRGPLAFAAYNPPVAQALFDLHNAAVAGALDPAHARARDPRCLPRDELQPRVERTRAGGREGRRRCEDDRRRAPQRGAHRRR
jgi:hypothetical protein